MNTIVYRITLREPALVTELGGDPNAAVGLPYLPGSVLRGVIIGKYLQAQQAQPRPTELDAADSIVRRLFFDGSTRYLNGYPVENGLRTLPVPLSWHREKGEKEPIYDFAVAGPPKKDQWQSLEPGQFSVRVGAAVHLCRPGRHLTIHTARNRRLGRPQERTRMRPGEDPGAIYRYEALAAGQTFEALILCDHAADTQSLKGLLSGSAWVGKARTGGYGQVTFAVVEPEAGQDREVDRSFQGGQEIAPAPEGQGQLIVTALSDALLRDENGQFDISRETVTKAVAKRLGGPNLACNGAFLRGRVVAGFNRKWGLPLPQALAVAMGSVFVFDNPNANENSYRKLEHEGIGERRTEGFGRVAVNLYTQPEWSVYSPFTEKPEGITLAADTGSGTLALQMVDRLLGHRMDNALIHQANQLGKQVGGPKKSQLARLRLVLQDALRQPPDAGRGRLLQYLRSIEDRQSTRKQFTRDRVAGQPLLDWLRHWIGEGSDILQELNLGPLPKVGGIAPQLSAERSYEYKLRYIDAVLARAAKVRAEEDH